MYNVTVRTNNREDATKLASWFTGSRIDHRSNFLFVVTGKLDSQEHNGTFLHAMTTLRHVPSLLIIDPVK